MITQARLKEVLDYDPTTGVFRWRTPVARRISPGQRAGSVKADPRNPKRSPRLQIRIDNRFYTAHHLAWLYVYGVFPPAKVTHKDGDTTNNRIDNLEVKTPSPPFWL